MVRGGEYGKEGDQEKTAQAKYKANQSLERAEDTIAKANRKAGYAAGGNPQDDSDITSADRRQARQDHSDKARDRRKRLGRPTANRKGLRRAPSVEAAAASGRNLLRVPAPLEGDEKTHKTAAVISRRGAFTKALTQDSTPKKQVRRNIFGRQV